MKTITLFLAGLFCLLASKMVGQSFEDRARLIANKIETVTKDEKAALKQEVEKVNEDLQAGRLTTEEADQRKMDLAQSHARAIEEKVAAYEAELRDLVQQKIDGKIHEEDTSRMFRVTFKWRDPDNWTRHHGESRTTTQFVFATGVNNLVTNGAVANSDFRYWGSHFYEWGFTWNTRLMKTDNLLHAKYGFSLQYNNLRPTDNRMFVDNGSTTDLETNSVNMRDSRFRNVNLVFPVHLEFDFTRKGEHDGKPTFRTHEAFRFGIGGYAGVNLKTKQVLRYDVDGYKERSITKGSFNVNDFIYGVSAYVGYEGTSLYVKYDLNPLFKDNPVAQRNVSLGVRFDLN